MDSKQINQLLEKYWACESTLEEEQALREYFRKGNYPEQLRETAALFTYFGESKKKSLDDAAFNSEVMQKVKPQGKLVPLVRNAMRIAAGIAVLVVAFVLVRNELRSSPSQEVADTYDDPKLAFEETKKALLMISKSFGTAEKQARKISVFNEAEKEIQKTPDAENNIN